MSGALTLPTEPIGSIPRPLELVEAIAAADAGALRAADLEPFYASAVRDTIRRFEATGSPVISDGEQRKPHGIAPYCVHGAPNVAPDGFRLRLSSRERRWPRLTAGPFRYRDSAARFLAEARSISSVPVKQAVVSPASLSLMYPLDDLAGYCRESFIADLVDEHVNELRACLAGGAHTVQVDFTESWLAHCLDPSGGVLRGFVELVNLALEQLDPRERARIGVHAGPDAAHELPQGAGIDPAQLLPSLFELHAASFFIALSRESERGRVLALVGRLVHPGQRVYVGVIDPLDARVETPEEVRDRLLEAAEFIPPAQLGSTDDCGFPPFTQDPSRSRDTAFDKIGARVLGTRLAAERLARHGA